MPWTLAILEKLKIAFNNKPFVAKDAIRIVREEMGYSHTAIKQALYQLTNEGWLIRIGRGMYKFREFNVSANMNASLTLRDSITVSFTSGFLIQAENLLKEKGIDYMITGPSALTKYHQHLSRKLIHLIYVISGAGEYACSTLSESRFRAFLNPSVEQMKLLLDIYEDRDLFLIREYSRLEGNIEGRATIEKALVDTYFETTRNLIPFSELEVGRIIANAFKMEKLSYSQILYFADRHGIKKEFQTILKELEPDAPVPSGNELNKVSKKVIEGIKSEIRGY